jgi:prepilin signal peptidase PulO-like enzyme (type II secretory pathway)
MNSQVVIWFALALLGLCFGSFAGALVWRFRAKQLQEEKAALNHVGEEFSRLKKLTNRNALKDRSVCLHCGYQLEWYDLIPLASWVFLRGKCRKCHKPIGYLEPLVELGVALFFVLSFLFWPLPLSSILDIARLVIWLISGVGLAILFIYDTKWSILPDGVNYFVIGLGVINAAIVLVTTQNITMSLMGILGSVLILSGLYWVIYVLSRGKWIGFGDIKLGLGLALLLSDWKLAFVALFTANLVGSLLVLPAVLAGKLKRNSRVPFGPLLIIGFVVAGLAGNYLLGLFFYTLK